MGIRLDWEIEAEKEHTMHTAGEDPNAQRRRRRARLRFFIALCILLALIGGAIAVVVVRLRQVDEQTVQIVRDTVSAEVAMLRLGDRESYLDMQRSASDEWVRQQDANFERYQALKQTTDITLSGRVIDAQVDGNRARVEVEEIISGVPYGRMWFYWRYSDGWRHVPPDYTFWGEAKTLEQDRVTVKYNAVDEAVAEAVVSRVADWLRIGCQALSCGTLPRLTVDIQSNPLLQTGWSGADAWTLDMPSPYITSARLDQPFDTGEQVKVATLLADRLIAGETTPTAPSDAYFLHHGISEWLIERFAQVETESHLVSSLAENYGEPAVGLLLQNLQGDATIGVLSSVTGTTLDAANLDWRDYLTWRLTLENDLIAQQDQENFLALYDTSDAAVRDQAYARYEAGGSGTPLKVVSAVVEPGGSVPQLRTVVQVGEPSTGQEEVLFRLVDGVWKRAS
jgi:hypothetical protein